MCGPLPPLLLVRHGRTDWNRHGLIQGTTDVPLDRVGRAQADRLARALGGCPLARFYASPLLRARETAERIRAGQRHAPNFVLLDDLRELSYGICQGKTPRQWAIMDPDLELRWRTEPWRAQFPNGETLSQLLRRAERTIGRVREDTVNPNSPTLVVAHGHILRALLLRLRTWPLERFWSIDVPNASVLTFP